MELINKKYKLLDKIGEGSFGVIYKGQNIRTNELVAIKIESIKNGSKLLKNESIIYQYLINTIGIPNVKWFGKDTHNYYMVLNLLGESLQSIKDKKEIFSLRFVLELGIKLINLVQIIHDKGLIHRDIKPENFLMGLNSECNNIYIIDFGFCKSFMQNNAHIKQTNTHNLIGSHTYASINAHNYKELSRRDDLESLGYMLMHFYLGKLTWQENEISQIKHLKQSISIDNLPEVLTTYVSYVRDLQFEETPNYKWLIHNFRENILLT